MHTRLLLPLFLCFIINTGPSTKADNADIMSCVLCEMVVEAMAEEHNPAAAMASMYRRCSRMGLLSPVCDQLVGKNAKTLLLQMSQISGTPRSICIKHLKMCDETL